MTPVFCCGFECGQIAATSSSVGEHWVNGNTGFSIDTTIKRTGARSLKATTPPSTGSAIPLVAAHATINVVRFYIYFSTLPGVDIRLYEFVDASNFIGCAYFQSSDSKIYAGIGSGLLGSTGVTVTTDRWYRIDIKVTCNANPWTNDVQVDGIACGQYTQALAATSVTAHRLYHPASGGATGTAYFDDYIISNTAADYPIGNGAVRHFIPTSDGTHNIAGTGDFQRTLTGTDILNATTTAFQLVDDVPLESGASVDWINMVAPPNATDYVECIFGPASGVPTPTYGPRAVEVIAGIHQAGTGTGNMLIQLNDNGTTGTIYTATTVAGVTSVAYKRAHFATAPTGGAWGVASGNGNFNNVRFRFRSPAAVDANPDQYLDCIMIEAEFAEWPQKIIQVKQAVNRSNTY